MVRSHSALVLSRSNWRSWTPALLTSTQGTPNWATTWAQQLTTEASSARFTATRETRRPAFSKASVAVSALAASMSAMMTKAPASARVSTMPRPIPMAPPVTRAILPVRSKGGSRLSLTDTSPCFDPDADLGASSAPLPLRAPLLREGRRAFLRIFAAITIFRDVPGGLERGRPAHFGRQHHHFAGRPHRQRCAVENLGGQLERRFQQPLGFRQAIDQADLIGALGADRFSGEDDLHHDPLRNHVDQRRRPGRAPADFDLGDGEFGSGAGDAQVAGLGDQPTAGESHAVDGGDGRLAEFDGVAGYGDEIARRDGQARLYHLLEIAAGAKGFVAGARQNGDAQRRVPLEPVPGGEQASADFRAERVPGFGTIEGDDRDPVRAGIEQHGVVHLEASLLNEMRRPFQFLPEIRVSDGDHSPGALGQGLAAKFGGTELGHDDIDIRAGRRDRPG